MSAAAPRGEHAARESANLAIAGRLREAAELLEQQGANPFRVNAYRRGAATIETLHGNLRQLSQRTGAGGLEELPGIGRGIATAVREMLATGHWSQLERLRGSADPIALFTTIPGIGPDLARRIHDQLGIETLEALETAAHDGRLDGLPGVGPRRLQGVRVGLSAALGRLATRAHPPRTIGPEVGELLAIDAQYRDQARSGKLRRIAPKRFNPGHEAWLPVMHAQRGEWHYTALFSNTARAHELRRTGDWVVIYYYDHDHVEAQCTVVTESTGGLRGRRVVRGRESECEDFYAQAAATAG